MFELRTLGIVQIRGSDGRPVEALQGRSRRLALLAYLAIDRPVGLKRRDTVVTLFWPDAAPERGRGALRQALQTLADALGPRVLVGRGSDSVGCNAEELWCDARALERASEAGRHAEVLRLFGGDFLPGFFVSGAPEFEAWVDDHRLRLRKLAARAAGILAEEAEGDEALDAAVGWAERAVELAPDDENLLLRQLQLLDRLGRPARGLEAYAEFRDRVRRQLGVEPSAAVTAAAEALRRTSPAVVIPTRPVASRSSGATRSVAVLPLLNLSGDGEFEYFTDGLTEELIAELSMLPDILVAARTSSFAFRARNDDVRVIGRRLGVNTIVEGSIRRVDSMLRITLQAIDAATGFHRWSDSVDFPLAEALRMPQALVGRIAPALHGSLLGTSQPRAPLQTDNREAFLAFLRGRYHLYRRSPADLVQSVELFERARALDPGYAAAHGGLALALATLPVYAGTPTETVLPRALEVAQQGLESDPELATAHLARSLALAMYRWDWEGAEASAVRALQGQPPDPIHRSTYALYVLAGSGRFEQALLEAERARDADPLSLPANAYVGYVAYLARRYELADQMCRTTLELDPRFPLGLWIQEMVLEQLGQSERAVEVARRLVADHPDSALFRAHLARAMAVAGDPEAREELDRLVQGLPADHPVWYWIAGIHGALGDVEEGVRDLEHALEIRSNFLVFAAVHPTLDPVRAHPRFAGILQRLGRPVTMR
jgi:TolB-like protein/DNA-binding SARP family transcriptional activator